MFQDDPLLVFGSDATMKSTLDELKTLGVDRIRVSLFWKAVAPQSDSTSKPTSDLSDPAAYDDRLWDRYDRLILAAQERGIAVNLNPTTPLPRWASTETAPRADVQLTHAPDAAEFGRFVAATARRYSGDYKGLPRVDHWGIFNEPNQAGWLTPQWVRDPRKSRRWVEQAPHTYRALVRTSYQALLDTGHGTDTILIGETAPKGLRTAKGLTKSIDALRFVRSMYCLNQRLRPFRGSSATVRGCPTSRAQFVAQNPGLFRATGFAHHPYELYLAPTRRSAGKDWVTIANLPTLSRELRRIYRRYRQSPQTRRGTPLYLTEYGYQTPPDPLGIPFSRQARYLMQAEEIAYRNPLVRAMSQFLLVDDAPTPGIANKRVAYRTFQSGLKRLNGTRKPAYRAYETPIHLSKTRVRRGRSVRVFGLPRAASGPKVRVSVQFLARGAKKWRTRKRVTGSAPRHYVRTRLRITRNGSVRLRWRNGARTMTSRTVSVRVIRR